MKPFISKTAYGVISYALVILLIPAPWLFKFSHVTIAAALFMPVLMGWLQFIMSVFSESPLGFSFLKVFPIQMQNFVDVLMGSFLLALPFTYSFCDQVWLPHFLLGLALLLKGIFYVRSPFLTLPHRALPDGNISSTDSLEGRLDH